MPSYVFITQTGCDPQFGKPIKDPYLGRVPTLGACRPDIRRRVVQGDRIFVISGKVSGVSQLIVGGLTVSEKISATEAFNRFPGLRLTRDENGFVKGNVICDSDGFQHRLDHHRDYEKRLDNYIVGTDPLALTSPAQMQMARAQTLDLLRDLLNKTGETPYSVVGRASRLDADQATEVEKWLRRVQRAK